MEHMLKDPRFAHVAKDPKFRRIPKAERKVKIDKRFQSMFKDKKFMVKYTIDKRGRPVDQSSMENLKKYYDLSSTEDESDSDETTKEKVVTKKGKLKKKNQIDESTIAKNKEKEKEEGEAKSDEEDSDNCFSSNGSLLLVKHSQNSDNDSESDDESNEDAEHKRTSETSRDNKLDELNKRKKNENVKLDDKVREKLKDLSVDYARGEGVLFTDSSSSEEESSEYSDEGEEIEHDWGELDKEAERTDEITHRLALCNMDWDRIRAVDIMVLLNSFLPSGGIINSVTIYPSEFGLKRMKEEEIKGPIELVETTREEKEKESTDEENEEGSTYHMEKLRQYQLNRLKYYYAVVDCDSNETANKIYTECDGVEYESTATKLDLRFIPNDMEFDQEPKEVCTGLPEFTKYQPRLFTTTALQQVKVDLTWDETNPERQEFTQKLSSGKIDELNKNDLQAYLASGTSDSESDKQSTHEDGNNSDSDGNQDPIEKYKALLKNIEDQEEEERKKKQDVEMEFTWDIGKQKQAEKMVKERLEKSEDLTPFEQYLEKRKAKKKEKKQQKRTKNESVNSEEDSETDVEFVKSNRKAKSSESNDGENQCQNELELLLMDKEDGKKHFNMKEIEDKTNMSKSKQKRLNKKNKNSVKEEDDFKINVEDPRFAALFTSHHYNIDPADPHFRKTKGTEVLISEKLKRRANDDENQEVQPKRSKENSALNTELQALVKSVKKNTKNIAQQIK